MLKIKCVNDGFPMRLISFKIWLYLSASVLGFAASAPLTDDQITRISEDYNSQIKLTREKYKDDLDKMTTEVDRLTRELAKSLGQEQIYVEADRQKLRYGNAVGAIMTVGSDGKRQTVDVKGWIYSVSMSGEEIIVKASLDKARYKTSQPLEFYAIIRSKGKNGAEETQLMMGNQVAGVLRAPLRVNKDNSGIYETHIFVPPNMRDQFVVQFEAVFEPTWRAVAVIGLEKIVAASF